MSAMRRFADRYAVELLFAQLLSVVLNVFAAVLLLAKLFGVCGDV